MFRFCVLIFVLCIGIHMISGKNHPRSRHQAYPDRFRPLRDLMGKLIDTESNIVYSINGQKQDDTPSGNALDGSEASLPIPVGPPTPPTHEEIACLAACHTCIEDYPIVNQKRAADNCGPMCDCADSCFRLSVDQVGQIYGQRPNGRHEKGCWWKKFQDMLEHDIPPFP